MNVTVTLKLPVEQVSAINDRMRQVRAKLPTGTRLTGNNALRLVFTLGIEKFLALAPREAGEMIEAEGVKLGRPSGS